jgi:hypothetical protein
VGSIGAKAERLFDNVEDILEEWNIGFNRIIGMGSDGASNMNPLSELIGEEASCLVWQPCCAHVLHLLSSESLKGVTEKGEEITGIPELEMVLKFVKAMVENVNGSSKRRSLLADLQLDLNDFVESLCKSADIR